MSEEQTQEKQHWIVYPLGSKPKWGLAVLLGIQQYLTMFGATVLIPFIVGGTMGLLMALGGLITGISPLVGFFMPTGTSRALAVKRCC